MFVYKYRGGPDDIFERDLNSLEKNYFWSSSIDQLNDPCETIIVSDKFIEQTKNIGWLFGKKRIESLHGLQSAFENLLSHNKKLGIYSLSKTYLDELLWAHYAFSHRGFCVEYDSDLLLESFKTEKVYPINVVYSTKPPEISIGDITIKNDQLICKMAGIKSKRWEYEKEFRIITNFSDKQIYKPHALKAIYFGLRMDESQKNKVFERLRGRNIKYYQILQEDKTYKFKAILIESPFKNDLSYLKQIPFNITGTKVVNFEIIEEYFINLSKIGRIKIQLDNKITKVEIEEFAKYLKEHLFQTAEKLHMFYYLPNQDIDGIAWATSHITDGITEVTINDFVLL